MEVRELSLLKVVILLLECRDGRPLGSTPPYRYYRRGSRLRVTGITLWAREGLFSFIKRNAITTSWRFCNDKLLLLLMLNACPHMLRSDHSELR